MSWLHRWALVGREAIRLLRQRGTATVTTALALGGLCSVALAALVLWRNVEAWSAHWPGGTTVVAYLSEDADLAVAQAAVDELAAVPGVRAVEFVPASEAADRLRDSVGEELLEGLDPNALPASIELVLEPGLRDVVMASPLVVQLRASTGIDGVEMVGEWQDPLAERLGAVGRGVGTGAVAMMGIVLAVGLWLVWLQVRTGGAHGAVVDRLGGGTWAQIGPGVLAAGVLALIGAGMAVLVVHFGVYAVGDEIGLALGLPTQGLTVRGLTMQELGVVLGPWIGLAMMGGSWAPRRRGVATWRGF